MTLLDQRHAEVLALLIERERAWQPDEQYLRIGKKTDLGEGVLHYSTASAMERDGLIGVSGLTLVETSAFYDRMQTSSKDRPPTRVVRLTEKGRAAYASHAGNAAVVARTAAHSSDDVTMFRRWAEQVRTLARHSISSPNAKDAAAWMADEIDRHADRLVREQHL